MELCDLTIGTDGPRSRSGRAGPDRPTLEKMQRPSRPRSRQTISTRIAIRLTGSDFWKVR